jgi:hypothetical protein
LTPSTDFFRFLSVFQKTIYEVKKIDLKKTDYTKEAQKSGEKFPIKRKKIEKVQICQNAPTPLT